MGYTPEQLNDWANQIAMHDYNYASPTKADIEEQLRAHAAKIEECDSLRKDAIRHYAMRAQFGGFGKVSALLPRVVDPLRPDVTYNSPEAYDAAIDDAVRAGSFPGAGLKGEPK